MVMHESPMSGQGLSGAKHASKCSRVDETSWTIVLDLKEKKKVILKSFESEEGSPCDVRGGVKVGIEVGEGPDLSPERVLSSSWKIGRVMICRSAVVADVSSGDELSCTLIIISLNLHRHCCR